MNFTPHSLDQKFDAHDAHFTPAEINAIFEKSDAEAEKTIAESREAVRKAGENARRAAHKVFGQQINNVSTFTST